ncbi:sodium:neurotransmitter symporter [uncultured Streptomyces sp.]|uniref:sodium:neurotransmitter symporter n=1 Tax=uncultured Streptomyces sp. TaxID=174707 RepID=UPI0026137DC8|nr:sodium:neurotransmitter symporter [uncultured Streptomyces sp.]
MRTTALIVFALVALLCGAALLYFGVTDAGDGEARAVLPIIIGAFLAVGGLVFLRKGLAR